MNDKYYGFIPFYTRLDSIPKCVWDLLDILEKDSIPNMQIRIRTVELFEHHTLVSFEFTTVHDPYRVYPYTSALIPNNAPRHVIKLELIGNLLLTLKYPRRGSLVTLKYPRSGGLV